MKEWSLKTSLQNTTAAVSILPYSNCRLRVFRKLISLLSGPDHPSLYLLLTYFTSPGVLWLQSEEDCVCLPSGKFCPYEEAQLNRQAAFWKGVPPGFLPFFVFFLLALSARWACVFSKHCCHVWFESNRKSSCLWGDVCFGFLIFCFVAKIVFTCYSLLTSFQ